MMLGDCGALQAVCGRLRQFGRGGRGAPAGVEPPQCKG
jgi:hypothetical protein